jgi:DNA repair photolyase
MIMSIKPNKHNYNFVDNIFSSKVPNVCNEIQTAKRKLRKLEKRKLRKDAETEEERKLREQGKTKRNGLIYSSLEEGRLDRVLEYNADKNEFIN